MVYRSFIHCPFLSLTVQKKMNKIEAVNGKEIAAEKTYCAHEFFFIFC